ncbi:MAG TPA: nucleotidyl transferase AbiEii/AbiGii toxin family protein [Gammaproteobacteria bacterium]|nr:nucleotidyl transferase AbiEii/AbiGii toxin family protein [Gammaproteobacteria bacterium]
MSDAEDFNALVNRAMQAENLVRMRPVVAKELLHYDILYSLDRDGLLDQLTFQGGTALRLCYGSPRYSEDLDFVGGRDFSASQVKGIKVCLERYIGERYGLLVEVKEPKETAVLPEYANIKVDKWQIRITTSPARKDLPKQAIKLEVANIPAYTRVPQAIKLNYDFLPDGYGDVLILTESLDEIMTDKIIAYVSSQKTIRYRDLWDLRWLKQHNASLNKDFFIRKVNDYQIENYEALLISAKEKLESVIRSKEFVDQMSRFIPLDTLESTLYKPKFIDFLCVEIRAMLDEVGAWLA